VIKNDNNGKLFVKSQKTKYRDAKQFWIEEGICVPCQKGSNITKNRDKKYVIIYPYDQNNNFSLLDEKTISTLYSLAYAHLQHHMQQLCERDKGAFITNTQNKWYEYGRSQGIKTLFKSKLILSPFVKDKINVIKSSEKELFISGYAIIPKPHKTIAEIEKMFKSTEMNQWIYIHGKTMNQGWISLSKNTFKKYKT
jgi:hypothetical protein